MNNDLSHYKNHNQLVAAFCKTLLIIIIFISGFLLIVKTCNVLFPIIPVPESSRITSVEEDCTFLKVGSISALEKALKLHNLWDIKENAFVQAVVFDRYPVGLVTKSVKSRKKIFFNTLLPVVLIVQEEAKRDRQLLQKILGKIVRSDSDLSQITFDQQQRSWQQMTGNDYTEKALKLAEKYRSNNAAELLERIDVIPASLALAQAAIESAWGSSRFAVAGNNIFGIWTWKNEGIIPTLRESGKKHKVAVFDSLLDSVRAYTLMINRFSAYERFRKIRRQTKNSFKLAEGLLNYSARRQLYVEDIKRMIRQNNLTFYDSCVLALKNGTPTKVPAI